MKIEVFEPSGFCSGVKRALHQLETIKLENPDKQIILLGNLIHNEYTINKLKEQGITILLRYFDNFEMRIKKFDKNKVIFVFSAHGHDPKYEEILKKYDFTFFDTTCPIVQKNKSILKNYLDRKYHIIFVGKHHHPETAGMMALSKDIYVCDPEYKNHTYKFTLNKNYRYVVVPQTTISLDDFLEVSSYVHTINRGIEIRRDMLCGLVKSREEGTKRLKNDYTCILVVGSKYSSNTTALFNTAKFYNPDKKVLYIYGIEDIKKDLFTEKDKIIIFTGTSTPEEEIKIIIKKISSFFQSK